MSLYGVEVSNAKPSSSAAGGGLSVARVTLTNAEILALPTSVGPIIVAAPGAGKMIVPVAGIIRCNRNSALGYANLDGTGNSFAGFHFGANAGSVLGANGFLMAINPVVVFGGTAVTDPMAYVSGMGARNVGPIGQAAANFENQALRFGFYNHLSGNLTGGNAINSAKVYVFYQTLDFSI